MSFRIAHNHDAAAAHRRMSVSADKMAVAMRRLSSGLRINTAADDASGLGISERMRAQIRGLEQASRNVNDGISLLNTLEGALQEVHSILQRGRELAVQYNNGINDTSQRQLIIEELAQLSHEIARIEETTTFNGIPLLQDALAMVTLQVGANQGETVTVSLVDLFGPGLSLVRPVTFFAVPWSDADLAGFDTHIQDVSLARARVGAQVNRLEHILADNQHRQEILMGAESRLRDVDMATEMMELTKQQVLQSSTSTVLLFATRTPERVLDLL